MENLGPFCQSCAMPLVKPEDFGTDETGIRNNEYCHFCFQNGKFVSENISMEEMIEISAKACAANTKMSEDQARDMLKEIIPQLKRWKK